MRIAAIGAHPDDIEIYCSGFLAAAQSAGHHVEWVVVTSGGAAGTGGSSTFQDRRQCEASQAAQMFGVSPIFLNRTDGGLSGDAEAIALIEGVLRRLEPDLVITHAPNDYHPDHRALSDYTVNAASYRAPVLFADTMLGIGFEPTLFADISDYMDRKKKALALHASQPTAVFLEIIEVWNRFRALQSGDPTCRYAEAFHFEPRFPFGSLRSLVGIAPLFLR